MTKNVVALILYTKENDKEQQKQSINIYLNSNNCLELVGMIELLNTFTPQELEVTLKTVKNAGIESIIIDSGIISKKLIKELREYVANQRLELIEINTPPTLFKRFLVVLPEYNIEDEIQLHSAKIIFSNLENKKEIMDVVTVALEYAVSEIIILSDQDMNWTQNTYLYKLHRIAMILNINVCLASNLENYYDK